MILLAIVLGIVAGGIAFRNQVRDGFSSLKSWAFGSNETNPDLVFETVKSGPFVVAVTESGSLSSLKNSTLSSSVEGTTTIIFIVPEGTEVKAPITSKVAGTVIEIVTSGDQRTIVVESDPIIRSTPWFFLQFPGIRVEHSPTMGKSTKLLVEQGDHVKVGDYLAGDVLCELDSSALVEKEKTQQIAVTQASANLEKARKDVEITLNQNLSDLAAARLKLELARLDLRKFVEGEKVQQENEGKGNVLIAQDEMTQADETYQYYIRLAKKGYRSQVELETQRIKLVQAKNKLDVARDKLNVLQQYTFERTYRELKALAEEAGRELKRTNLKGLAALATFQAESRAKQLTFSVEQEKLERLQRQIKACKLVAPQDGKVQYANQRSRRSEVVVIEEGVSVRERQRIINLPDFSQMKVEAKIHESKISNVREGLRARIRIAAIPDRVFNGIVETVPDVPVKGEWPNTDLMLYETMIRITDDVSTLKPGMNANVAIIAQERDNVLQIPIQAIVAIGDSYVVYIRDDSTKGASIRHDVKIGASNAKMIEVKGGLQEGEQVVMNPMTSFGEEIAELRAAANQKKAKANAKAAGKRKPYRGKGGGKTGGKKRGKRRRPNDEAEFKKLDKNGDGKIDKSEADPRMAQFFDRFDTDKNGTIDLREFKAAMARMRAFMKKKTGPGGPPR
jgi:HlyD family secretion protein